MSIVFLIGGLVLTVLGSNWLVTGASSLAKRLNVSDLVIGLTIVAFGTSSPELTVNLFASMSGSTDLAIGNVLGSNIFNSMVILGVAALIYPVTVQKNSVWIEIPLSLLAAIMLAILANDVLVDGDASSSIDRGDGLVLLGFFLVFMYYTFFTAKNSPPPTESFEAIPLWKSLGLIAVGLGGLFAGGKLVLDGAVEIARALGMTEAVIGLTIVAAGTSLPELATSAMAAFRKNSDIAIGNVIGSNIFNVFFVLGTSATISPLPFSESSLPDVLMVVASSVLVFLFAYFGRHPRINRIEGGLLVAAYIAYLVYLLSNN